MIIEINPEIVRLIQKKRDKTKTHALTMVMENLNYLLYTIIFTASDLLISDNKAKLAQRDSVIVDGKIGFNSTYFYYRNMKNV